MQGHQDDYRDAVKRLINETDKILQSNLPTQEQYSQINAICQQLEAKSFPLSKFTRKPYPFVKLEISPVK